MGDGPGGEAGPEREAGAPRPPGAARRADPDPLGKRALFSAAAPAAGTAAPVAGTAAPAAGTAAPAAGTGAPDAAPAPADPVTSTGPIAVTCSACGATSRVGVLDFLLYQLPVGYWLPRGRFGHRMTCPRCRRRTWAGVTLRRD